MLMSESNQTNTNDYCGSSYCLSDEVFFNVCIKTNIYVYKLYNYNESLKYQLDFKWFISLEVSLKKLTVVVPETSVVFEMRGHNRFVKRICTMFST